MTSPTSDTTAAPLPPELAQIAAEAAAIEPPPAADPMAMESQTPPIDYQEDAAMLVDMMFEGCAEYFPSTGPVLQPKQTRFTNALAKVMEKRGWSLAAILGRWGAEIELAFVASTLALPLTKAIQADRAAAAQAKQAAEIAARPADPQPPRPAVDPYATFSEQQASGLQ